LALQKTTSKFCEHSLPSLDYLCNLTHLTSTAASGMVNCCREAACCITVPCKNITKSHFMIGHFSSGLPSVPSDHLETRYWISFVHSQPTNSHNWKWLDTLRIYYIKHQISPCERILFLLSNSQQCGIYRCLTRLKAYRKWWQTMTQ
jgi:hypothetical protein